MLVLALNAGHDSAIATLQDGKLLFALEAEKDSYPRHAALTATTVLEALKELPHPPDVVALGGWTKGGARGLGSNDIGAGYLNHNALAQYASRFAGREVTLFTSSHERSHIAMAIGMAPRDDAPQRVVLVYEGAIGSFYLLDDQHRVVRAVPVLRDPGLRYAFVFGLADPSFPDRGVLPRLEDAGKLMALAAFARPEDADPRVAETVDQILSMPNLFPAPKWQLRDSPLYNVGVEADDCKAAAALISNRIFEQYAQAARSHFEPGLPLYISGGCGLNCDWNRGWRELGHFSSVFVPPCTNDAGSAIGTAIDAQLTLTGDPFIEWDIYAGLEFVWDRDPDGAKWHRTDLDNAALVDALAGGEVVAWVQGRWEIGPRALGNRSLLAEPFEPRTRERLNEIKQRESYRPIAPVCRVEDLHQVFMNDFEDPYMLYFRLVRGDRYGAVTHVDGSARCQTVSRQTNTRLHELLTTFGERHGAGMLCNTSLNFKGCGFINRMSDLAAYCEVRGVDSFVAGENWFRRPPRAR